VVFFGSALPRVPLGRVIEAFGPALLQVLAGPVTGNVDDVVIHDPTDAVVGRSGDLVLAVGVRAAEEVVTVVRALRGSGTAGLVVKVPPDGLPPDLAAITGDVTVLGLAPDASWSSMALLVRSLLPSVAGGGDPAEDLFGLAEAVSAMVNAAVTIEDTNSRVLAFSGGQDEADPGRHDTILGRRVPVEFLRLLEERGVFRWLGRESTPIYVDSLGDAMRPRVAVSVRAGSEHLGSIWAVVDAPLPAERQRAFVDAANVVALHLLRLRAEADIGGRLQADLVSAVLQGGRGAVEAASRLGIGGAPLCVLAAQPLSVQPSQYEAACQQIRQRLAVHSAAIRSHAAIARVGGVVYGIFAGGDADDGRRGAVVALAEEFVAGQRSDDVVIGIGRAVNHQSEISRSRGDADRALRVLCHEASHAGTTRRVARFADVQTASLLLRLADVAAEDGEVLGGPLDPLFDYDAAHRSGIVETVAAYLDAFGDVAAGAAALYIHPNTFRYRLRRAAELSGLDLADPEERLGVLLQLRLRRARPAR
jgi:hypothetical protein